MSRLPVRELPIAAKLAIGVTLFNSWVLLAETVVDRRGLWRYLPGYEVGRLCPWDVGVAVLILALWSARSSDGAIEPGSSGNSGEGGPDPE